MTHPPDDPFEDLRVFEPGTDEEDLEDEPAEEPKPALDEVLAALRRGEYPRSALVGLSDLTASEAGTLKRAWEAVAVDVRRAVVSELNDLAEERVDYLFNRALLAVLDDPDEVVRQRAVAGLWEHEDPRFALTLAAILETDPSEDVRAEAARGLGRFAELDELGELDAETGARVAEALHHTLADEAEALHVRARALESASIRSGQEVVRAAIERFYDEEETGYRATAIFAMGRSLDRAYLQTVINETSSDDAEVRYEAARAAGRLGDTEALPVLADLAGEDEDAEVRHAAINAMGEIGGAAAVRYLRRLAEEAPESDLELVEEAIGEASIVTDPLLLSDDPA